MDPASATSSSTWEPVIRDRFLDLWLGLPSLTVLTASPGWGRTTWMAQCRRAIADHGTLGETVWVTSRPRLERLLEQLGIGQREVTVFVDDVIFNRGDALWERVAAAATGNTYFVVSTLDEPEPRVVAEHRSLKILDERDLRFTEQEVTAATGRNRMPVPPELHHHLTRIAKGCPVLVRILSENNRRFVESGRASALNSPVAGMLVAYVLEQLTLEQVDTSDYFRFIETASYFRRSMPRWLTTGDDESESLYMGRMFARMRVSPLGDFEINPATGTEQFVWSEEAWENFGQRESPEDRTRGLRAVQASVMQRDDTDLQLFYALELEDLALADRLAYRWFRYYQLQVTPETRALLLALPHEAMRPWPYLMHLASDTRIRTRGPSSLSTRGLREFLERVRVASDAPAADRFRTLSRRVAATVSLGDRAGTQRLLTHVSEMLEDESPERSLLAQAHSSPLIANAVALDMYPVYWAATQVDDHDLALRVARYSANFTSDFEQVEADSRRTLHTQEDFAGLRSMHPQGELDTEALHDSHSLGFLVLESGNDRAAIDSLRMLYDVPRLTTTRSAGDGFTLFIRAVTAPRGLDQARVEALVQHNRQFWLDGLPSTFVAFGATCAYLAMGKPALAQALWANDPRADWFALTAQAMTAMSLGDPGSAVRLLTRAIESGRLPRAIAMAEVLRSAALIRTGNVDAGTAHMNALWAAMPAPRLIRYGLRFVSDTDIAALLSRSDLVPQLRLAIDAARDDARPFGQGVGAPLTPAELEILGLLREGRTNSDIATQRFVSENTVRTQMRAIFRKLGVNDRVAAVKVADGAGLLG